MTYEEALDQVIKTHKIGDLKDAKITRFYKEAAEIYAKAKWDQACEAQQLVYFDYVSDESKPKFKP